MTYLPTIKKIDMSCYILNNIYNQTSSNTTYIDYQIDSGYTTVVEKISTTITIDTVNNRFTLPSGKYYLDAKLNIYREATGTWGCDLKWYKWDGSSKTDIGYPGREVGVIAIGDPHVSEHATAYVESNSSITIGLQFRSINNLQITASDNVNYEELSGESRLMIWRLE